MKRRVVRRALRHLPGAVTILLLFLGGTAASRIFYEALFPRSLWLGRPVAFLLLAASLAGGTWWLLSKIGFDPPSPTSLLPLLLNLLFLFEPTVDLVMSRVVFAASLWLVALLWIHPRVQAGTWRWLGPCFVLLALCPTYLLTMPDTVGRADTFEFQVIVPKLGVAHPTGYPLYILLARLFTFIPGGTIAWRVNLSSAFFALLTACLVFLTAYRLLRRPEPAVVAATVLGLTPTFWSQAIEAEVYALHALIVSLALWLMTRLESDISGSGRDRLAIALLLTVGLGLTNHVTSIFLLPAVALALWFTYRGRTASSGSWTRLLLTWTTALAIPLLIYAYLPIRWAAVNGEPMGLDRFVDWVLGGRFQDALRLDAWLNDPARYEIVGRIFLENWGWLNLLLAGLGFIFLLVHKRRMAMLLVVTWLGYTFYALNYHVPDLEVFLIPAHVVLAVGWAAGVVALMRLADWLIRALRGSPSAAERLIVGDVVILGAIMPALILSAARWPAIDRSRSDGLTEWGQGVLEMRLAEGAAVLADSEKVAPLLYLQQSENLRPDLEIMVLPDEAAYRAELDRRVAAGQPVYLARFIPGLAGVYHLRSVGPLVEVSVRPGTELPPGVTPAEIRFGPVDLFGFMLEPESRFDARSAAVTLYWRANNPVDEFLTIYLRWHSNGLGPLSPLVAGQHPVNNSFPTVAWQPGEIVSDFYLLPTPVGLAHSQAGLQVAFAPPFASPDELTWQTLTTVTLPTQPDLTLARPLRAAIGNTLIDGISIPSQIRPGKELLISYSGFGVDPDEVSFTVRPVDNKASLRGDPRPEVPDASAREPFVRSIHIPGDLGPGRYQVEAQVDGAGAICSWGALISDRCILGGFEVSGNTLPAGAVNFDDQIGLLSIDVSDTELQPGGRLTVNLDWASLGEIDGDYTVFVQVVDAEDKIVGQVDSWPVQGTYPTSEWLPDETINDSTVVQLDGDLPAGEYRLYVGWYLLATLRRLPVLDASGSPVDDKVVLPGLIVR